MYYLLTLEPVYSSTAQLTTCLIYGVTSIIVLGTSTTYHFLYDGFHISNRLERFLEDCDHFAIYLFIAGTYTPFVWNAVAPPWRGILLALVWIIAIVGILYTHFKPRLPIWAQHRFLYTGIFIALGWTGIVRFQEISQSLQPDSKLYLFLGGMCYSLGAVVYATKWPRLWPGTFGFHELWHVAVLVGFGFHYFMVLSFYT